MRGRILYVQYTNPATYPPLGHSSRILADAGWEVAFLGTGAFGADALRFPSHPRIAVQQIPFCSAGLRQKLHYVRYAAWVLAWALRWKPEWVYASDPLSCPVAVVLSRLPGVRVLYHEHDSPSWAGVGGFTRLALAARRLLARRAQLAALPNAERARRFTEETGATCPVLTVWNCPTRDEVAPPAPARNDGLAVVYHGSIGPARLPQSVVLALAQLPAPVRLRVVGYETVGHAGYVQHLARLARKVGAEERLEFMGPVPRRHLLTLNRQSDVGLAFLPIRSRDINHQHMVGASNKPFDYLASGLAVLVPDAPQWRQTYVDPGYGLACDPDDPSSIASALRWLLEHPEERRAMGDRGRQRILDEWNYERQFAPVLERLTAAVASR